MIMKNSAYRLYIEVQNIKKEQWQADENSVQAPVRGQVTKHDSPHRYWR